MSPAFLAVLFIAGAPVQPYGDLDRHSHEIVLGVPHSGKTPHARERVASARRVVFFDPTGDFESEGEVVTAVELEQFPELLSGRWCRIVVAAGRDDDLDVADEFIATVKACRAAADYGGLVLVADEVGDYSARAGEHLKRLHRNGHHRGVASILVSQCAVDVPLTCRRTATRVTSLRQENVDDLEQLAELYGADFAARAKAWHVGDPPVIWTPAPLLPNARSR